LVKFHFRVGSGAIFYEFVVPSIFASEVAFQFQKKIYYLKKHHGHFCGAYTHDLIEKQKNITSVFKKIGLGIISRKLLYTLLLTRGHGKKCGG
jgi:hypothetical protein